ncbi:MAG: hypothetical protein AAF958_15595 [Planctomycetota bacterium]
MMIGLMLFGLVWQPGCSPTSESQISDSQTPPESMSQRVAADTAVPVRFRMPMDRGADPVEVLRSAFDRYRTAKNYADRGRLVATQDGPQASTIVGEVPMAVWMTGSEIAVRAYATRVVSNGKRLRAWFRDELTDNFDSQVLVRDVANRRPTDQTLALDPILVSGLGSGAAGPPPQLEWLFAAKPMEKLLRSAQQARFGKSEFIDGHACTAIQLKADDAVYSFWVDRKRALIRRIDFPDVVPEPDGNRPPATVLRTRLHLDDATFQPATRPPRPSGLPKNPIYVKRFVPLPPPPPPATVGREYRVLRGRSSDAKVIWFAKTSNAQTLRWLIQLRQSLQRQQEMDLDIVLVAEDEKLADAPDTIRRLDPDRVPEMPPESLWVVETRRGRVHFLQPLVGQIVPDFLLGVSVDVDAGVNVAERLRSQHDEQIAQYRRVLQDVEVALD